MWSTEQQHKKSKPKHITIIYIGKKEKWKQHKIGIIIHKLVDIDVNKWHRTIKIINVGLSMFFTVKNIYLNDLPYIVYNVGYIQPLIWIQKLNEEKVLVVLLK